MTPRTVDDVIRSLPRTSRLGPLERPRFDRNDLRNLLAFATLANKHHMTDEGWQLFEALHAGGYTIDTDGDVPTAVEDVKPRTVITQDKREWEGKTGNRSGVRQIEGVGVLRGKHGPFKGTVLKDAQHDSAYNRQAAEEIGCHFWICYYHPRIVSHLSPFVRPEHLVRTHHSLDKDLVPPLGPQRRSDVLLSGAVSAAYPLRQRLVDARLPNVDVLRHPGYHQRGCETAKYLDVLSHYKVAVCTSSRYGYAVRKIAEATACGCAVLTDLPSDEVMPEIDGNLVRVHPQTPMSEIADALRRMLRDWNPERQQYYADCAKLRYDYRETGRRLADDIETLRRTWR